MCPKYSFSLLLWLQSFPIYLGTLKPEVQLAIPRLPCSYLISQATELKPLGRKQKCWVGPLRRLLERSLPPTFSPSRRLVILDQEVPWRRKQCCKAKRRKLGHSWLCGVAAWTLNGLFLLFFYVKKFTTLVGSLWPVDKCNSSFTHVGSHPGLRDSPGLVSNSSWQHLCFFLFLLLLLLQPQILWEPRDLKNNSLSWL